MVRSLYGILYSDFCILVSVMIAIIDYEAGNLTSVQRALSSLGRPSVITRKASELAAAERIVFPGVGAAGKAMADLRRMGLDRALFTAFHEGKPILGICLGTQIIMEWSEENRTPCLGLIRGKVIRFPEALTDGEGRPLKAVSYTHLTLPTKRIV